jgi:hypothetical protein
LCEQDLDAARELGSLLGYAWHAPRADIDDQTFKVEDAGAETVRPPAETGTIELQFSGEPLADVPYWYLETFAYLADAKKPEKTKPVAAKPYKGWEKRPQLPPEIHLLSPWSELQTRLRGYLTAPRIGHAIDIDLAVRRICQRGMLMVIPRERRRRWGPFLQLIEDHSQRLIPLRTDQRDLRAQLRRILLAEMLTRSIYREGRHAIVTSDEAGREIAYRLPPKGSMVLVLSDLGVLADVDTLWRWWADFGKALHTAGCRPIALSPLSEDRLPEELTAIWRIIPWERRLKRWDAADARAQTERLLRLVSPAVRIEPGLLRAIRRLMKHQADITTELRVWNHPAVLSRSYVGATLHPKRASQLREAFIHEEPVEIRRQVLTLLRDWRGYLPEEIWYEELLNLDDASLAGIPASDRRNALRYFESFCSDMEGLDAIDMGSDADWLGRIESRSGERLWTNPRIGEPLLRTLYEIHRHEAEYRPPTNFRPDLIDAKGKKLGKLRVMHLGVEISIQPVSDTATTFMGSPLTELPSHNGLIQFQALQPEEGDENFWLDGKPPDWADDWGTDEYGHWVEFSLPDGQGDKLVQRMRWIEPGSFLMGSDENEPGRFDDEGPQHRVEIRQGYWLFDTACTQAVWQAVMGNNPSRFQGYDRPVERVSWNECLEFLKNLTNQRP